MTFPPDMGPTMSPERIASPGLAAATDGARMDAAAVLDAAASGTASLVEAFRAVRSATVDLADGLDAEDLAMQSMPDASPGKWHLAHTAWFFETFVLRRLVPGYRPLDERYAMLFNSYYVGVGASHPRASRGLLSRPSLQVVLAYRAHVDAAVLEALERTSEGDHPDAGELRRTVRLGLHHEQQHQELFLTDLGHAFSCNPTAPAYRAAAPRALAAAAPVHPMQWITNAGGLVEIGRGASEFAFDNEGPRHRVWLPPFALASRPVTCREWLAFLDDGGYRRPELWMSLGWECVRAQGWEAPAYWRRDGGEYSTFTLAGMMPLDLDAPVVHIGWFEADAYARWSGHRLPTETEWEHMAQGEPVGGNFVETGALHPRSAVPTGGCTQLFGDVWEWTASPYAPYPGYRVPAGALGEYNGKFMCNQYVLRGGSCASPRSHLRATYRNYFPPDARWQFSGVRLARDP